MSPQTPRYPSPAAGDAVDGNGRHRRPESLSDAADEVPVFRVSTLLESGTWVPGPRSARHQRDAGRPVERKPVEHRPAEHRHIERGRGTSRPDTRRTISARHAAAHRPAAPERPPVTGSHRAPGTLPIESWLLMGKKRQQVLLASLIAVGLLLVAVPGARARDGVDAVNAAAQRAIGGQSTQTGKGPKGGAKDGAQGAGKDGGAPAPTPSASAHTGNDVPVAEATAAASRKVKNAGPGNSLRTTGTTAVALTFDDGPDPTQTPKILALLAKYQVKATFCVVGQQVQKHPEIVRDIVAAGHTLCNHTWNHSLTIGKDKPARIQADLSRTNAAILAAAPDAKIPFFRAPGGNFTDRLVGVAAADGMTSLYWQVDPQDWDHKTGETDAAHTARVIADVKKHVRPGSIVLSHDFNQPDTIAAYEKLLPWLKENFTLGIPGVPAPAPTTTTTVEPTPSETPATPDPSTSASPDPAAAAAAAAAQ
jgi:peptidoglycan/xylan/chitin deacetylase (PgdA/CDA1 family)